MTITLTREEAQQVLDALESCGEDFIYDGEDEQRVDVYDYEKVDAAIETFRARLAQPEPEPVAYQCCEHGDTEWFVVSADAYCINPSRYKYRALYTAPPQREWVGLSTEELEFYTEELGEGEFGRGVLRAVDDFLKEKNG